jgi:uncharacterized protein
MPTETASLALRSQLATLAGVAILGVLIIGLRLDIRLVAGVLLQRARWTRCLARLRRRPWSAVAGVHVFAPLALLYIGITLCGQVAAARLTLLDDTARFLLTAGASGTLHGAVVAVVLLAMRRHAYHWRQAFGPPHPMPVGRLARHGLHGYLAMLPLVTGAALLSQLVLRGLGYPAAPQPILSVFTTPDTPLWFRAAVTLMAVVTAPVAEELLFRGILLPVLIQHYRAGPAFLLTALAFAALHGHLPALVPLTAVGLTLGLAYAATGSLLVPILMHALFNGMSLLLALLLTI